MSETVEAIGYKADVPSRAKDKVSDTATRAKEAVVGTASRAGDVAGGAAGRVSDATPSGGEVKQQARRTAGLAKENPLGLAIGAAAIGFLAGLAVSSTRVEDEKLGPVADQVKEKVKETGQEAMDRGKQVAQEVASSAADTAKQATQEHGQGLAEKRQAERPGRAQRGQLSQRASISLAILTCMIGQRDEVGASA
jgi:hypothetical protein